MALLSNGLISGRIGDRVYFVRNGKQYVRNAPVFRQQPTALQKRQQQRFAAVMRFMSPLARILNTYFPEPKRGSAFQRAIGLVTKMAVRERGEDAFFVDPTRVKLTCSFCLDCPDVDWRLDDGRLLLLSWRPYNRNGFPEDAIQVIAYNESKGLADISTERVFLSEGRLRMELEESLLGGTVHLYIVLSERLKQRSAKACFLVSLETGEQVEAGDG